LGTQWRHITYDMRARGKSKRSADYSFETNVHDVDAVLAARGVDRALVVGWSYGAFVAAHWASRNPGRTVGAVLVDGAQARSCARTSALSPTPYARRPASTVRVAEDADALALARSWVVACQGRWLRSSSARTRLGRPVVAHACAANASDRDPLRPKSSAEAA
jgi:pimeloyl-ACP methyl ester carboxylesterase